jgi:hypothetical protein
MLVNGEPHRAPFRSLAVDRLADGRQQLSACERLLQDPAHPKLTRHGHGGPDIPYEARGEKQDGAGMRFPDGLDQLRGTSRLGDVDDDEARISSPASRLRQPVQRFDDHGITRFAQPALEQAENQVVRFDDKYPLLSLHGTPARFGVDPRVTSAPHYQWPFHTIRSSRLSTDRSHSCHMTKNLPEKTHHCSALHASPHYSQ